MSIDRVKKIALRLTRPDIVFFALGWLIIILIAGTIAQKYIGLYQAQNLFFSSLILWLGFIPLPGGAMVMAVIFICLLAKMLFASAWSFRNSGILITHGGALLLLFGGLLTAVNASEGSMVIFEGEHRNYVTDYHLRELVISEGDVQHPVMTVPWSGLYNGAHFKIPGTKVQIEIVKVCRNCVAVARDIHDVRGDEFRGKAREIDILPAPVEKEDEKNQAGIQFRVSGAGLDHDGIYFSVDFIDQAPTIKVEHKSYRIALQKHRTYLPFSIRLLDFEKTYHPGTDIPRSYKSEIILSDGGTEWRSVVQMNAPLHYKGYTFYQSSFLDTGEREATVFAVVRNLGRLFPYISSIVMCIGLLIHISIRLPVLWGPHKNKALSTLIFLCVLLGAPSANATIYAFDFSTFSRIPILDQGRVKPIDTFARTYLELFSGKDSLAGMSAVEWLAEVVFTPDRAYTRPIFDISDPRVIDAISLPRRAPHVYSFTEVSDAMSESFGAWRGLFTVPDNKLTPSQRQLLDLYNKVQIFGELSRSLSLIFPITKIPDGKLSRAFDVPAGTVMTYFDLLQKQSVLDQLGRDAMKKVRARHGNGKKITEPASEIIEPMSQESAEVLKIVQAMGQIGHDRESMIFQVIPPQWEDQKMGSLWFSPWGITVHGQGSPDALAFIRMWGGALSAYAAGDTDKWINATTKLREKSLAMAGGGAVEWRLTIETLFNVYSPFTLSLFLYIAGFFALLLFLKGSSQKLYFTALSFLVGAFVLHGVGMGLRMFIMERPPVTNLYESVVFVGFIVSLFSLVYEGRMRNGMGIIIATSVGMILQYIGLRFDADGDTMGMLTAVLDTNFWLSTHVVMITVGYAACLMCGLLAHIYLVLRIARPMEIERASAIARNIRGGTYIALFFASLGTILGGIWADQSWGRFWGWDPKENGAMLICLWLLFLIHGRLAGRFGELGFVVGMVITNMVVALAWFGVNLLGVGLHSYGFVDNVAAGLFAFCLFELIVAGGGYFLVKNRLQERST